MSNHNNGQRLACSPQSITQPSSSPVTTPQTSHKAGKPLAKTMGMFRVRWWGRFVRHEATATLESSGPPLPTALPGLLVLLVAAGLSAGAQAQAQTLFSVSPTEIYEGETLEFTISLTRSHSYTAGINYGFVEPAGGGNAGTATEGESNDWYLVNSDGTRISILENSSHPAVLSDSNYNNIAFRLHARTDNLTEGDETIKLRAWGYSSGNIHTTITLKDGPRPTTSSAGVTLSKSALTLTELDASNFEQTYTVELDTDPGANVAVTVSSGDTTAVAVDTDGDMAGDQNTLTFTTSNWDTAQTVTVRAENDGDTAAETVTLSHTAEVSSDSTNPYHQIPISDVTATTVDAGHGVVVSKASVSIALDSIADYYIKLKSQPGGSVTIQPTSSATANVTVSSSRTFTNSNWSRSRLFTLYGVGTGSAIISHTVMTGTTAYPTSTSIASVRATVTLPTLSPLEIYEGERLTFTFEPTAPDRPNIQIWEPNPGNDRGTAVYSTDYLLYNLGEENPTTERTRNGGARLGQITDGNNRVQFDIKAVTDLNTNEGDETIVLLIEDDNDYYWQFEYTITLKDGARPSTTAGVTLSKSDLTLTELHTSDFEQTYTVVLDTDPGANVEVSVSSADTTAVAVDTDSNTDGDQSTLTFTHGDSGNWETAQTVTVRAENDGDTAAETVTLSHTAEVADTKNPYHGIPINDVTATTVDAGHGVVVSEASVTVAENSDTAEYTIKLKSQPGGSVTITPASSASANATVSGALTFTNANWSTAQTVTVTGVSPGSATISHAVTTGTTTYPISTMIASVGVTVSPAARNLDISVADAYEGENIVVTLTLSRAPGNVSAAQRTIEVGTQVPVGASVTTCIADHGCAAASTAVTAADFTNSGTTNVVFGPSETTKTVSIPVVADSVSEGVEVVQINIRYQPGTGDYGIFAADSEYTGRSAFSGAPTIVPGIILLSSYGQILGDSRPVPITITENGNPAATTVSEDGTTTTDTYTVVLDSEPSHSVTVTATAATGVQVQAPSGTAGTTATLTFTTSNWNQAQTITVTGVDDDIDNAGDARTVTIAHAASSTDPTYTITNAGEVSVTVTDDDTAGLVFDADSDPVSVDEGESGSYTVALASQPSADVTVTISGQGGSTDLTLDTDSGMNGDQATLTFTTSNWRVAQTVEIEAGQDDDATNDSITLTHSPSGGGYGSAQDKNLEVTITDDETVPTLKVEIPTVTEGETGTITLTLSQPASQSIGITVSGISISTCGSGITCPQGTTEAGSPADYSFTGITVTFAPGDRSKTVSFTTTDDSTPESTEVFGVLVGDLAASEATIDLSTPADVTSFLGPTWFIRIQDNDNPGNPNVTITPGTSPVTEGATATFTVTATPAPTSATTVSVAVTEDTSGGQDFVAASNETTHTVTIPAASSSAAGTVTLTIATVGDSRNEPTGEVTATVAGSTGYTVGNPSSAMVTVNDDDNPANPNVTIAHGAAAVNEGESLTFTVSATPAPTVATPVSVAVTEDSSSGQDFLAASDETTHTVTVTAAGSEGEGTATLTIATVFNSTSDPQGKVTATVAGGTGYTVGNPSSAMVTVRNLNPPPIPPKPTGFMATAGDGEVTLSWNDPSRSTITWWQYRQKEGSGSYGSFMRIPGSTATTTSYTVTGLTNGTTYTFQVGAVASNLARTAGGLVSDEQSATPMMADTTAPTVTSIEHQTPSTSPTNADTLTWRVTFNEAVVNVDAADFTLTGPNSSTTLAVTPVTDSETTTYDVTASGGNLAGLDATVTLSFNSGHDIEDEAGNDLASSPASPSTNQNSFEVDNTAPTVTSIEHQTPSSSPTNADSLTWRVTFNEAVENVNGADFTLTGPDSSTTLAVTPVTGSETTTYDVTASGGNLAGLDGTVTLSFNSGHDIEDEAGNDLASSPTPPSTNQNSFVVDNTAPTVTSITRQTPSSETTNADSLTWRVTFSEAVVNVNAADFTLTGPNSSTTLAVTLVTDSETTTYDVTASGGNLVGLDGTVTLSFASNHDIEDEAGNDLASSPASPSTNQNSFVVDNMAPTVTSITRQTPSSSTTNADSLTWRVTFDEPVQQVDTTDFQVSGSPATTVTITGVARDGSTNAYDVTASGGNLANYDGTVTLSFNSGHNIEDEAGNDLASSPTPTTNQNSFVVDNMAPSVVISGLSGTISGAATATFTFNETVSGFDTSDIVVSNSAVSVFAEDTAGTSWTATITPNTNGTEVTINVAAGAAQDEAGNNSTAATRVTVNYTAPLSAPVGFAANGRDERVELSWAAPSDSAGTAQLTKYQYRYQAGSSVTKADGWTDVPDSDDDNDATDETALTVTGLTNGSEYAFELKAVNGAGDGAVATATATPASSDTTAPTVTSIRRQTPSSSPTNADSLTWRVTFNEAVVNVDTADFQVSGSPATTATITGVAQVTGTNAYDYDVTASGGNLANYDGTVTLSFNSGHNIEDTSGNDLASSPATPSTNQNSFVVDNTAPTVSAIRRQTPSSSPTNADSLTWRVTFNEAVQQVDTTDFQVSGSPATTVTITGVARDGSTNAYDVTASGGNLANYDGTVTLSFNSGHDIEDEAGNDLASSPATPVTNQNSFVVDNMAPSVVISGLSGTISGAATATFTFNETVSGFDTSDIVVSNSAVSVFAEDTAGTSWTATITPNTNGTEVTINVAAGAARDEAGNNSTAATPVTVNYTAPLSAPVGFTANGRDERVELSWAAPSDSAGTAQLSQYQYRYQQGSSVTKADGWTNVADSDNDGDVNDETALTVTGLTNGSEYAFELKAVNGAGNGTVATATATPASSDTTAPTVTSIERQTPSSSPTNADSLTWRVTFSEAVVNVNGADFTLTGPNSSTTLAVTPVTDSETTTYDVTASGGNLAGLDATVTLSFNSGHDIEDEAGNDLASSPASPVTNQNSFVVDNTAPTVTSITRQTPSSSPTNADSLSWRVTFDEPVQQVDTTDFQVSGSPATTVTITGVARDGSTNAYDVTASGGNLANYDGTVTLSFNSGHNIEDEAGNDLASSPATPVTNQNSFVVDNMAPSVAISGLSGTISGAATATFTFNETVSGFDTSDIVVSNSAVSVFAEDTAGTSWTATITPNTNGTEVTINVATGAARDEAGNNSTAATPVTVNYTAPLSAPVGFTANGRDERVELSWAAPSDSAGTAQLSQYQYRYQQGSSVTKADGWTDVADSNDDNDVTDETAWTVTGLTNGSEYAFELKAVNGAGDGAVATATATPASSDTTAPTVTSIERQTPSSSPTNADSLTWRVTFSEAVVNVDAADFTLTGPNSSTTLAVTPVTDSETTTYDVTASGGNLAGLDATVTLSFNGGHDIEDEAGNDLASSPDLTRTDNSFVVQNTPPTITIAGGAAVTEGTGAQFTVNASPAPIVDLTVQLDVSDDDTSDFVISGDEGRKTVTILANQTSATYTVNTVSDNMDEPNGSVTVSVAAAEEGYTLGSTSSATVTVSDDDTGTANNAPTVTTAIPDQTAMVGTAFNYIVPTNTFSDADGDDLTYTATQSDDSALPSWLSFDADPDTRTFSGTPQAANLGTVSVKVTANDGNGGSVSDTFDTVVSPAAGVTLSEAALTLTELDASNAEKTYTVVLNTDPGANVVVTVTSGDTTAVTVDTDSGTAGDQRMLTFIHGDSGNWNAAQTVTLRALNDGDAAAETVTISHVAAAVDTTNPYHRIDIGNVAATTVDAGHGVTVSRASVSVAENSATAEYMIALKSAPGGSVVITPTWSATANATGLSAASVSVAENSATTEYMIGLNSSPSSSVVITPTSLTFTDSNWDKPQTVTVTGAGAGSATISYAVTTPTTDYPTSMTIDSVAVTAVTAVANIAPTVATAIPDQTAAAGTAFSYAFPANTFRDADSDSLTYTATQSDNSALPSWLTFTPGRRRFSGTPAAGDGGTVTVRVTAADGNGGTVFDDFDIEVRTAPGLELSTGHLRVSKGGSISYTIALATQPSGPVRVSISGHEATGLTADATSLDFTPANWNVPKEVSLTAPGKAASITLTHTATGGNYGGIEAEVVVTVIATDPKARQGWLSRFGRTVSHQVVAGIQGRFAAPPSPPGLHLTVAGEEFTNATPLAENQQVLAKALGFETVTGQQWVEGSSFSFSLSADGTPARFAIWGQGALASFSGAEDSLSLDGDVSTALLGAEWSAARWRAGAALSHSWGSGSYAGDNTEGNTVADGDITTTLTGIFPYGRYRLTPRLGIWAITGYGWGDLTLKPDGDGTDYSPGTTMVMTAVGVDGLLLDGGAEGLSLTTTADALTVKTTSEAVAGFSSSEANISRLRLGLEATRPVPLADGASLLPSLELGIRQDRGDAETGFGMELGAGLAWTDSRRGISAELKGRTLLTHTEEEFREQGLAVSFAWDPSPSNRGPSLALSHTMGAVAEGGMDALLSPTALEALDVTSSRQHQFETKLTYGFPAFNDRLTITPGLGLALSPDSRTYSLLWALAPYVQQPQAEPWEISLEGERQEDNTADSSVEHSLKLRFSLPF